MLRNRLTLAILVGSPIAITAMYALLFQPGAFDLAHPSPTAMIQIGYWVVFASFFFGLTYGLLQICTERAIVSREHMVGLKLGAYLMAKVAVLLPFLVVVNVAMLGVMRLFNRLPPDSGWRPSSIRPPLSRLLPHKRPGAPMLGTLPPRP